MAEIQDVLEKIITAIPKDHVFDSHFIITTLTKEYSDTYLSFADSFASSETKTLPMHGKIGQEIAKFEPSLIERIPEKAWSFNSHGNASACTAWKRSR